MLRTSGNAIHQQIPHQYKEVHRRSSKSKTKSKPFNLIVGIMVLCATVVTIWLVTSGYLLGETSWGFKEPDEETPEQLRERLKAVFKERNELRKQVSEIDSLRNKVQSQGAINKAQLAELKDLRKEVKLYAKLKAQGVRNTITRLENDLRAYESLNAQYKDMLQECLDAKKEAEHLEMEAELAVEHEDEVLQQTREELENTKSSLLDDEQLIATLKKKLKNILGGIDVSNEELQKDKIIAELKQEIASMRATLQHDEEESQTQR